MLRVVLASTLLLIFFSSCVKGTEDDGQGAVIIVDDCTYKFWEGPDHIYGAWEPKIIIDTESGDSTFYELGEGHAGYILDGWYANAFELRESKELRLYYVSSGRPCEGGLTHPWDYENMMLSLYLLNDTVNLPVLMLTEEELIIEDVINFRESTVIMRKVN
ncbi:MAG: hypothetical protein ACJATF_000553 [Flavobacteriales bacterium]|jgi:hypothetical protein